MVEMTEIWAVGRRKTSIARVTLKPGGGKVVINNLPLDEYFSGLPGLRDSCMEPIRLTNLVNKFDVCVNVSGGGKCGQAGAIKLGISRAVAEIDGSMRSVLRKEGLLTRDPRMVERKKPGRPKARKRFQFSKR